MEPTRTSHLEPADVAEVSALATAAGDADGAYPLSEHVMLHLRHGGDAPARHLLIHHGGALVGYAHLDTTDSVEGPSAELVVHPMHRRRGLGRTLVAAIVEESRTADPSGRLRLWAHGDHPSATALAMSMGFDRHRALLQLRRSLLSPIPAPPFPDGVTVRPFAPGADDAAWADLNARVFAEHPDQGRWTLDDLRVRMAEPWFSPTGFLLAESDSGDLLGFHWTKVHGAAEAHDHDPMGEVYVLGVDPAARGLGLGPALTAAGLRYLRSLGLNQAMLYVDESNPRAVRLYTEMGFLRWSTDVSFRRA